MLILIHDTSDFLSGIKWKKTMKNEIRHQLDNCVMSCKGIEGMVLGKLHSQIWATVGTPVGFLVYAQMKEEYEK
jgi:hypothetical protein